MDAFDSRTVSANGIRQRVYVGGSADGQPVLFIHGNCSAADFWRPLWRHLPDDYFVVAPDLRGYGGTDAAPVDATRGLADFADDVAAAKSASPRVASTGAASVPPYPRRSGAMTK